MDGQETLPFLRQERWVDEGQLHALGQRLEAGPIMQLRGGAGIWAPL